jgi:hypothetical protein
MEMGRPSIGYAMMLADQGDLESVADLMREVARHLFEEGQMQGVGWAVRLTQQINNGEMKVDPPSFEEWPCS